MTRSSHYSEIQALAESVLNDEPCSDDGVLMAQYVPSLARAIEKTIEDWFNGE